MLRLCTGLIFLAPLSAGCLGDFTAPDSTPTDPSTEFPPNPPDVDTGWPDLSDTGDTTDTDDTDSSARNTRVAPSGPFDVTWKGGDSYASEYGGKLYALTVIDAKRNTTGGITGRVPTTGDWNVTFKDAVQHGGRYELHLWIDTNLGGGEAGWCDGAPTFFDRMWSYEVAPVKGDLTVSQASNTTYTDVCASF